MAKKSYRRATALVVQNGRVLLVRHRGEIHYSLPGGRIDGQETALEAAIREVREETALRAYSATRRRDCDCEGSVSRHFVSEIRVGKGDKIKLEGKEISKAIWWDGHSNIRVNGHVYGITKAAGVFPHSVQSNAKRTRLQGGGYPAP